MTKDGVVAQGTPKYQAGENLGEDVKFAFARVNQLEAENAALSALVVESRRIQNRVDKNEVWHWQGDGEDFPESLGCPVIMSADTLRSLLAQVVELQQALLDLADDHEFGQAGQLRRDHLTAARKLLVNSTVTRASVPPSISDGGKDTP